MGVSQYGGAAPPIPGLTLYPGGIAHALHPALATGSVTMTSGFVSHAVFQQMEERTVTGLITHTRGTAAGATPSLCRMALEEVTFDGSGNATYTKVAQCASDTSLWAGTFTKYERALSTAGGFPASYTLKAGKWYAGVAICVTAAAAPVLYGSANGVPFLTRSQGGNGYTQTGQSDIGASVSPSAAPYHPAVAWVGAY